MSYIFDRAMKFARMNTLAGEGMMLQAVRLFMQTEIAKDRLCAIVLDARYKPVRLGLRRKTEYVPK